jgi:hypothetical protein
VLLKGVVCEGDSGSQIVDKETRELYGNVVAGDTSTGLLYVMAAYHVFEDMKTRMGNVHPCMAGRPSCRDKSSIL